MDYLTRDGLEHKVERELVKANSQTLSPMTHDPSHPLLRGLRSRNIAGRSRRAEDEEVLSDGGERETKVEDIP